MKHLMVLALFLFSYSAQAHECDAFATDREDADEAYACTVSNADVTRLKMHRMEVCIGSVPLYDGTRYAHLEIKSVPLSQYNNPFSQADGSNNTFFDKFYSGLSFLGEDDNSVYLQNETQLLLTAYHEGSKVTHSQDILTELKLRKNSGQGKVAVYRRDHAYLFTKDWEKTLDLALQCQRIR